AIKILEYEFDVKYIPGPQNCMPDYLSRSPVDDAEEEPDETSSITSTATQTESEGIATQVYTVNVVQTRAAKLRESIKNNTTDNKDITTDPLPEENRIIPFSIEDLIQAQQNDAYAKNIAQNIKENKRYYIENNLLMRRLHHPVPYVPAGELRLLAHDVHRHH
ncbi:unnamed protein product, partial [Adineta ricciae]